MVYGGYKTILNPLIRENIIIGLNDFISRFYSIKIDSDFLIILGIFEVVLGVLFLAWFLPKRTVFWAGLCGAIEFGLVLLLLGLSIRNFTYIGILGALIAVTLTYRRGRY